MIILVEDDADQRLALGLALKAAGYSLREVANGVEALDLQHERPAQFLITDLFMPETDGLELLQAFHRGFPETKIVVVSGGGKRAKGDYLASAKLIGADATFEKPVEIEALLDTLRALTH